MAAPGSKSVGPAGTFSNVSSVRRVHTKGGVAPGNGCSAAAAGTHARVPYTADYYFFTKEWGVTPILTSSR